MHGRAINPDQIAPRPPSNKHGAESETPQSWYILRCVSGLDFTAEEKLRGSGWPVFLAREPQWQPGLWRRKKPDKKAEAEVQYPRFPGYLFLAVCPPRWPDLEAWPLSSLTRGFLKMAGQPVPLAPGEIERLMAEDGRHVPHTSSVPACRAFAAGDRVRVLGGAFRDFVGELDAIDGRGAHLSVLLLGRRLRLPLPLTWVEHA